MGRKTLVEEPDLRTEAGLAQKRASYINELGELVYAWNALHENLCEVFCAVLSVPFEVSTAIWHSIQSDRAQRNILRAATENAELKPAAARKSILWLVDQTNKLADKRNDAIHSPYAFVLYIQDPPVAELLPFAAMGNPRSRNLASKELLAEFRWYRETATALGGYAIRVRSGLLRPEEPWPDRPILPILTQKKTHPD